MPMKPHLLISLLLLICFANTSYGGGDVLFSSLPRTLVVIASPQQGLVLKAGEDRIVVSWGLNQSLHSERAADSLYKNVKLTLCYAPESQVDRAWRKTVDNLRKDKTCQFTIVKTPYNASAMNQSFKWRIEREVPTATYFVRAYAYNSEGEEVGFGQTTDTMKSSNLFEIQGISGRHASLEIASICFSAFSVLSLFGFFLVEKRKGKNYSSKL